MTKKKSTAISSDVAPPLVEDEFNQVRAMSAAFEFHGRNVNLDIVGTRTIQISADPTELGVNEFSLDIPGIRVRIIL